MSLFCRHRWEEVQRKAVPGAQESGKRFKFGGGVWAEAHDDMLYGFTLIEQRCNECGKVRIDKFTGAIRDKQERES